MSINALYKSYFQKSRVFLYPLLDIRRGASVIPEQTYVSWQNYIKPEDTKLVAVYPKRDDVEYKNFEKHVLLKHSRVVDFIHLNDTQLIVTFDFSDLKDDWSHFINGKFSKLNIKIKNKILNFFEKYSGNYVYMQSYLMPEDYFDNYAELLNVNVEILKSTGELCNLPDLEKETLFLKIADLNNISENLITLSKPS